MSFENEHWLAILISQETFPSKPTHFHLWVHSAGGKASASLSPDCVSDYLLHLEKAFVSFLEKIDNLLLAGFWSAVLRRGPLAGALTSVLCQPGRTR